MLPFNTVLVFDRLVSLFLNTLQKWYMRAIQTTQGFNGLLMDNSQQIQILQRFTIPLHIRQENEAIGWTWILISNPFRFFLMLKDVIDPLFK